MRSQSLWTPWVIGSVSLLLVFLHSTGGLANAPVQPEVEIKEVLEILNSVPIGKSLIKKALEIWNLKGVSDLAFRFRWGEVSRTDTVLTRTFNPQVGQENRERKITIYLKEDQSELEAIMDAAHELVHAVSEPAYDPYDPQLTPGKYIWTSIEGIGGEVEAVSTECEVGVALSVASGVRLPRCQGYFVNQSQKVSKDQIRRDFYRVGDWKLRLARELKGEAALFPLLSSELPTLYSSTGHAPYPVALLKEFEEITQIACENSRKRLASMISAHFFRKDLKTFLLRRCSEMN